MRCACNSSLPEPIAVLISVAHSAGLRRRSPASSSRISRRTRLRPACLARSHAAAAAASTSLALVGLFNIFGTYLAGNLGQKMPKRYLLSGIYSLRSVATVGFLLAPLSA